jgi:hypothetical protein
MKPVHIVLLVLAGALGGAVVMKVAERPRVETAANTPAPAPSNVAPASAPAPAAVAQPEPVAAPVAAPEPVAPEPAAPQPPEPVANPKAAVHARRVAVKHTSPKIVYSNARPSPFHKQNAPPVEVAQAAPRAPVEQPATEAQLQAPADPAPSARPEPAPETPASAPQPVPNTVTLNAGMLIPVRLVDGLSSERNAPGDAFVATLDRELVADGFVIAERGARVEGRVVTVDRGTKVHSGATLVVELTRLNTSDHQTVRIQTEGFEKRSEPNHTTDGEKVGGGAVIGAIIGAIAGGGKGAAVGAGVGGGVGAGDVLLTRKPATLPSETRITFRLKAPVTLTEKLG